MNRLKLFWKANTRVILLVISAITAVLYLLLYKLGSLNNGNLSYGEFQVATKPIGWHGLYQDPLFLPMSLLRSITNVLTDYHSEFITRLPNVIIGLLTIVIFAWLIRLWHGTRTAILSTLIFATSAWVLHASRLASYDVVYLLVIPALLLTIAALQRHSNKPIVFYGSMLIWGSLIYVPGAIWLVVLTIYWERRTIRQSWKHLANLYKRILYVISGLVWLPLLINYLLTSNAHKFWLGLPEHFSSPVNLIKNVGDVLYNLFVHGPTNASIWLSTAPIFDVLTLTMFILGIYFYIAHWRVGRARILLSYLLVGIALISIGGTVGLSLVIPLVYICAATGIAYLIQQWLQIFPFNPVARSIGITLVVIAIALSCAYNLRSYFIAWPHNSLTQSTFHYKIVR